MNVRFLPCGDSGLTIEFGREIDEQINKQVCTLAENIKKKQIVGVIETIPTFRSLFVLYNPLAIKYNVLIKKIKTLLNDDYTDENRIKRVVQIPVCYGGKFGEDLADVAKHASITENEVIELHSSREYLIYMLGFLPGFTYLGGLDKRIVTPRLQNPRTKISAGSVGIGGEQTGIYPLESPGGWRLIGRTPIKPYDPNRKNPILFKAGDYIKFIPINEDEFNEIEEKVRNGEDGGYDYGC